jgi:hypothetical protein
MLRILMFTVLAMIFGCQNSDAAAKPNISN